MERKIAAKAHKKIRASQRRREDSSIKSKPEWLKTPEAPVGNGDASLRPEPEWFTTPEAAKILGLQTVTLQDWIVRGYVAPQKRGIGYGSKHYFSKAGLVQLLLFRRLVNKGLSRKEATRIVVLYSQFCSPQEPLEHGFLQVAKHGKEFSADFLPESDHDEQGYIKTKVHRDVEDAHLVNLGMIMDEVDRLLERK